MTPNVPILLYHHVAPDREVTPQGLERQLSWFLEQGFESRALDDVLRLMRGEAAFSKPSFAVTFDDGYVDNWVYAFPVLKKLRIQSTMYLVTDRIESGVGLRGAADVVDTRSRERSEGGFVSWAEVETMASSGLVTMGSHTRTHRHFVRAGRFGDLESELAGSKAVLESQLNRPCKHLAWPWGDFESAWLARVQAFGYHSAATTLAGANARGRSPYWLRRIPVRQESVDWLASRMRWNRRADFATGFGLFYGWDRRLKTWWQKESPYSHG